VWRREDYSLLLTGSEEHSLLLTGSEEYSLLLTGSEGYSLFLTGSEEYSLLLTGSEEYSLLLTGSEGTEKFLRVRRAGCLASAHHVGGAAGGPSLGRREGPEEREAPGGPAERAGSEHEAGGEN
jgi:hypothetical protein